MRNVSKDELARYTKLRNELAIQRTACDLEFAKIRSACDAPEGLSFDEITGQWLRPVMQNGQLAGYVNPDGTPRPVLGQATPAPPTKEKFEKKLLKSLRGGRK